ncbi:hypothetical protein L6R49_00275 [Myxococcota bacterium]|nr:hypothetical protein [Myxococcota bacterium]
MRRRPGRREPRRGRGLRRARQRLRRPHRHPGPRRPGRGHLPPRRRPGRLWRLRGRHGERLRGADGLHRR